MESARYREKRFSRPDEGNGGIPGDVLTGYLLSERVCGMGHFRN